MTREDAERICNAHGWVVYDWDERGLAHVRYDAVSAYVWLPAKVLAALDQNRPPTLAALRRLWRGGLAERWGKQAVFGDDDEARARIASAWELGGDP